MWKVKANFNVDKLKICFKQPQEVFEWLKQYKTDDVIYMDSFSIHIIDDGRSENSSKQPIKIIANILTDDRVLLGKFSFNDSAKYEGKCFFEFTNQSLYTIFNTYYGVKHNYIICLDFVAQHLNLEINNITELEVACDINHNPLPRINKLLTHHEDYDFILNGKVVDDHTKIMAGIGEFYGRSRVKKNRYPTLYLSQKKEDSPSIKIYDKRAEIEDNSKHYISDWNDNLNGTMYRIEVNVKNEDIKKFLQLAGQHNEQWGDIQAFLMMLSSEEYRYSIWEHICDRIVYFRAKSGDKEVIRLHSIITKS